MESLNPYLTFFAAILIIYTFFLKSKKSRKIRPTPQAGGAWPIVGHLPLLAGSQPAHVILGDMVDKYGPIFTIKLGVRKILIVSSSEIAKECLTTHDRNFASRPRSLAMEILGYDHLLLGVAPYGDYWRQVRKTVTVELLSNYQLDMLKHVREDEVKAAIKELHTHWSRKNDGKLVVEMKKWFSDITLNVILKLIVGKRYVEYGGSINDGKENDQWINAINKVMEQAGRFAVSDALPYLRWFDIGGNEKEMKKTAKEVDIVLEEWLQEHKANKKSNKSHGHDFMGMLLSVLSDGRDISNNRDNDVTIKAICLSLIVAASDTTSVTLTWALSLLLNRRETLKKVQEELAQVIGKDRQINESDMNKLVYFHAVAKETLRLYPAAPMLLPHQSMEDCVVAGYHVPAGTQLFINVSKIQTDPKEWSEANEFRPERFLKSDANVDIKGQHYELLPFGSGRRMCPGLAFGLQVFNLALATFLHSFEIDTLYDKPLDMTKSVAITNVKANPVEVVISPRLPSSVF